MKKNAVRPATDEDVETWRKKAIGHDPVSVNLQPADLLGLIGRIDVLKSDLEEAKAVLARSTESPN